MASVLGWIMASGSATQWRLDSQIQRRGWASSIWFASSMSVAAPNGHGAMSVLSPLSGVKRKSNFGTVTSVVDPERTFAALKALLSNPVCSPIKKIRLTR
jgi:hypothetical protein